MTLLTLPETAEMLKVSPRTVRRLPIPRAYVGGQLRYDLSDLGNPGDEPKTGRTGQGTNLPSRKTRDQGRSGPPFDQRTHRAASKPAVHGPNSEHAMRITRTATTDGVRSTLDYRYRGGRYRPVLGYNLTSHQEHEAMVQILARIQAHVGGDAGDPGLTFAEFVPKYLAKLTSKKLQAMDRPTTILHRHLVASSGCVRCAR